MKDQPWDLNQTWPVGRKCCRLTNAPQIFGGPSPKFGAQTHQIWNHFFRNFHTPYETSHGQTKMLVSVYKVTYFP